MKSFTCYQLEERVKNAFEQCSHPIVNNDNDNDDVQTNKKSIKELMYFSHLYEKQGCLKTK